MGHQYRIHIDMSDLLKKYLCEQKQCLHGEQIDVLLLPPLPQDSSLLILVNSNHQYISHHRVQAKCCLLCLLLLAQKLTDGVMGECLFA